MTVRGHVENGAIVLDEAASLPEGALVLIEVQPVREDYKIHPEVERISGLISRHEDDETPHLAAHVRKHQ